MVKLVLIVKMNCSLFINEWGAFLGEKKMSESRRPLVSICIPAYNNADYICETLDTVMNQTYENIELVVVDDGSKDNTWNVINKYKEEYEAKNPDTSKIIRLYKNEKNLGMAGNWNRALELCTGEYLKLICADDLMDENLTEREVAILEEHADVVCVSSDTQFIDLNGKKKGQYKRYKKTGVVDGIEAVRSCVFTRDKLGAPVANLFRRTVYEQVGGFDPSFIYIIDYDFYMRVYCAGKVFIIHEPLNFFRIRNDSNTGQVLGGDKGAIYIGEHRRLVTKISKILGLKSWQIELSVIIRRMLSFAGNIYLRLTVPKEA